MTTDITVQGLILVCKHCHDGKQVAGVVAEPPAGTIGYDDHGLSRPVAALHLCARCVRHGRSSTMFEDGTGKPWTTQAPGKYSARFASGEAIGEWLGERAAIEYIRSHWPQATARPATSGAGEQALLVWSGGGAGGLPDVIISGPGFHQMFWKAKASA